MAASSGGFAGAVTADQGDPLTGVELEIGMIEQGNVAIGQTGVVKLEIGHRSAMKTAPRRAPRWEGYDFTAWQALRW